MADNVPIFRGDGSAADPKPQLFFNMCESYLMDRQPEYDNPKQMRWFRLKLEPGSDAEEWFDALQATQRADMSTLRPVFDTQFPPDPKATKSVQDKWERLLKHVLLEEKMLDIDDDGVYAYVKWGARMLTLSKGISDSNGLQAGQIRDLLPKPLKRLVGEVSTFQDLATKVQGVKKKALEEAVEDRAEVTKLRQELASSRSYQRAAPETPTRGATAAMANMGFARANTTQQPLQSLIAALTGGTAVQGQQAPRAPNTAFGQRGGGGFQPLKHSDEDIALRTRAPAVRLADFNRTKLRRTTTVEEYRAQVAEFDRAHGNVLSTECRAYPLTPGTADAGTGECIDCGLARHRDEACTTPRLSYKERDYRRMASAVTWAARPNAGGGGAAARTSTKRRRTCSFC